jgi:hypothetical protein
MTTGSIVAKDKKMRGSASHYLKRTRTYNPDVVDENILILFLT